MKSSVLLITAGEGPCILTYFVTKYWQLLVLRLLTGISLGGTGCAYLRNGGYL